MREVAGQSGSGKAQLLVVAVAAAAVLTLSHFLEISSKNINQNGSYEKIKTLVGCLPSFSILILHCHYDSSPYSWRANSN